MKRTNLVIQLILRIAIGIIFLISGIQKIQDPNSFISSLQAMNFPLAEFQGWLVILSELICGTFLIFGLLLRFSIIPLAIIMLVGLFTIHFKNGFNTNTWYTILLFLQLLNFGLNDPQKFSLDYFIKNKK